MSATSPNTKATYQRCWRAFEEYCASNGHSPLPASVETVLGFVCETRDAGRSAATLNVTLAAIGDRHRRAGEPNPATGGPVREMRREMREATAEQAVSALTSEAVGAIRQHLRSAFMGAKLEERRRAYRNMALVSVLASGGLRASEIQALTWRDVRFPVEEGAGGFLMIRPTARSRGPVVAISPSAGEDLRRWFHKSPPGAECPHVFPIAAKSVSRIVKTLASRAGLGEGFSARSGRAGMIRQMIEAGAPPAVIARQARWKSARMVLHYAPSVPASGSMDAALRFLGA